MKTIVTENFYSILFTSPDLLTNVINPPITIPILATEECAKILGQVDAYKLMFLKSLLLL
jgi:hypothetical protein